MFTYTVSEKDLRSPTCQGYSFLSVALPPTILKLVTEAIEGLDIPQEQPPPTMFETIRKRKNTIEVFNIFKKLLELKGLKCITC